MIQKIILRLSFTYMLFASFAAAQGTQPLSDLDYPPYNPAKDPNIDIYTSSWKESTPKITHGNLIERDIFTKFQGEDPYRPTVRGAVLKILKRFTHGTLYAGKSTTPTVLKGEQEIFYVVSGKGTIKAGDKTADLHEGINVMVPPGLEFTMTNTGSESLVMYVFTEDVPEGFKARTDMVVKDENTTPFDEPAHWTFMLKRGIWYTDGLAKLVGMGPVWITPMTMGEPHSHKEGVEEIWIALEGDITFFLGKQIRKLPVGSAYMVPSNEKTPHSNINLTDQPIKMFWIMRNPDVQ
jgi:mannose-6-phosphate isomerase-like protein (cupin superfamily)